MIVTFSRYEKFEVRIYTIYSTTTIGCNEYIYAKKYEIKETIYEFCCAYCGYSYKQNKH